MIDLPRDLAPWRAYLDLFPRDLAAGIGRFLPQLSLAVGPMRAARPQGGGEPDGFAGIARRGSYERLLLTEWLLADEAPLEFIRRAASGEHAFHQIARRTPAQARSSVALFDAGPDQLGGPRLAHLAALIVLAARSERARARFAWGLLHRPEGALFTEVTQASVTSLLGARTAVGPSADDVAAWADRARQSGWEDAWIVGAPSIIPGWRHAALEVRDVLDPSRRVLAAVARAPGAPPREVELPLPPEAACARLLRDPFAAVVAPPAPALRVGTPAPVSNLVFAANGTKLFARAGTGEIVAFPVPNSPHATVGRPKRYRPRDGGVVAAAGWIARGLAMLTIHEGELVVEHTTTRGPPLLRRRILIPHDVEIAAPQPTDPLSLLVFDERRGAEIFFADARRALFQVGRDRTSDVNLHFADATGPAFVRRIAYDVAALAVAAGSLAFVGRGSTLPHEPDELPEPLDPQTMIRQVGGSWHLVHHETTAAPRSVAVWLPGGGAFAARFGSQLGHEHARVLVAWRRDEHDFSIRDGGDLRADVEVPEGARVIGPWRAGVDVDPELVLLDADERTISFAGRRPARASITAAAPIADAVLSTSSPVLAYLTEAGEVVLWSLVHAAPLARFQTADPR